MAERRNFAAAEYEGFPRQSCRMGSGERVLAYFDNPNGYVYVKTFGNNVSVVKATEREWENVVINHNIRFSGEEAQ